MANHELVLPIIHLNGTSREELLEQLEVAHSALLNALLAIKRSAPNGRDYYPVPGLLDRAIEQHGRRMRILTDLMRELEEECKKIYEE